MFTTFVIPSSKIYTTTMLAPVGKFKKKLINIPRIKQIIDIIPDIIINSLKLLANPFAMTAGKIMFPSFSFLVLQLVLLKMILEIDRKLHLFLEI